MCEHITLYKVVFRGPSDAKLSRFFGRAHHTDRAYRLFAEAQAEIAGAAEKYLMLNSPLHLECVVRQSPVEPVYMFWYHDSRMINYDADRGVNVTADLPNKRSTLYVERASRGHSGNYTCAPSNAFPANTVVHILNGKLANRRMRVARTYELSLNVFVHGKITRYGVTGYPLW